MVGIGAFDSVFALVCGRIKLNNAAGQQPLQRWPDRFRQNEWVRVAGLWCQRW
jgi:hypothetical protein